MPCLLLLLLPLEDPAQNAQEHTLELRRVGEIHVVDSLDNELGSDALTAEPTAVQALVGLQTTIDGFEFDIDLAVGGKRNNATVDDFAVLVGALFSNVSFEFLDEFLRLSTRLRVSEMDNGLIIKVLLTLLR